MFEAVRGRTSFQNQISIVRNEQMPRLLEVKDLDGLKALSTLATEETIWWKEQENSLLDQFNAIVTLDQEGDGLQQVTFAVDPPTSAGTNSGSTSKTPCKSSTSPDDFPLDSHGFVRYHIA